MKQSRRRTYRSTRNYSESVMAFRKSVYEGRRLITPMCQVLLLRMSDDMSADCRVKVARSILARDLKTEPSRITEWIKIAKKAGFLELVSAGKTGSVSEYHGLVVHDEDVSPRVSGGTPSPPPQGYAQPDPHAGTPSPPPSHAQGYAQPPTNEVVTTTTPSAVTSEPIVQAVFEHFPDDGFEEERFTCSEHDFGFCPKSCDNHPAHSRRLA